jgi:predicted amidophosphoribosyltransferase
MRSDSWSREEKSPCSVKNAPMPETVSCPRCAGAIEVWTDEQEAICDNCGYTLTRVIPSPSCGPLQPPLP